MKPLCIPCLAILLITTHVKSQGPCGERNVTGAARGSITLHVSYTGTRSISWTLVEKGYSVAITRLGGELEIQSLRYEGRLISSSDGSLTITHLQHEDQGTYRAQNRDLECLFHITVFNNLTAEDLTISSNVTNNETCEVILTCSVTSAKKSNVTFDWRSLNSSDISPTHNVNVSSNSTNFTYICTASNSVSKASKSVIPREYCEKDDLSGTTPPRTYIITVIVTVIGVFLIIIFIICIFFIKSRHKNKRITRNEPNVYEQHDEEKAHVLDNKGQRHEKKGKKENNVNGEQGPSGDRTVYDQVRPPQNAESEKPKSKKPTPSKEEGTAAKSEDPKGQKQEEERKKENNVNGEQGPSGVSTVYDQVRPTQNGELEEPKANQPTPSKEEGTGAKSEDPKATEPKGSPSDETTNSTLYSKVQNIKGKNGRKPPPPAPNGNVVKESCYALVNLPQGSQNEQKTSSKGADSGCSAAPVESCYAEVQHPQGSKNEQKTSSKGADSGCSAVPVESYYAEVQHPQDKKNIRIPLQPPNRVPPPKPPHSLLGQSKGKNSQKVSPEGANGNHGSHLKDKKNIRIPLQPPNRVPPPKPPHSLLGQSKGKNSQKVSPEGANGNHGSYEAVPHLKTESTK